MLGATSARPGSIPTGCSSSLLAASTVGIMHKYYVPVLTLAYSSSVFTTTSCPPLEARLIGVLSLSTALRSASARSRIVFTTLSSPLPAE